MTRGHETGHMSVRHMPVRRKSDTAHLDRLADSRIAQGRCTSVRHLSDTSYLDCLADGRHCTGEMHDHMEQPILLVVVVRLLQYNCQTVNLLASGLASSDPIRLFDALTYAN